MVENLYDLGNKKHVFIDWGLIEPGYAVANDGRPESWEMPYGLRLAAHKPRIDSEPLVRPDRPCEGREIGHVTMFEDDGLFRVYYECGDRRKGRARTPAERVADPTANMLAYAETTDGINWAKPNIGAVAYDGSKDNNLTFALENVPLRSPTVFKDPNAAPDQRYKLVYRRAEGMFGAFSSDGLHWTKLEKPLLPDFQSDTKIVVLFDPEKGRYLAYFRGGTNMKGTD